MMRIFALFILAVFSALLVYAQNYDYNSNFVQQNSNFCTGGACRIDKMNHSNFIQNDTNSMPQVQHNSNSDDTHNRGGLNQGGDFTYDFNCQFGNCLPNPAGSYKP